MTENEVEDKLTSFITVFKYIDDKDVFQKVTTICGLFLQILVAVMHLQRITESTGVYDMGCCKLDSNLGNMDKCLF